MSWDYKIDESALKELRKLGPAVSKRLIGYLERKVCGADDPRDFGKALSGNLAGLWSYRVGDHRLICRFEDRLLIVVLLKAGHRKDVYE